MFLVNTYVWIDHLRAGDVYLLASLSLIESAPLGVGLCLTTMCCLSFAGSGPENLGMLPISGCFWLNLSRLKLAA